LTRADLPPPDTRRWVASRKAAVVKGLNFGLISEEEAMERWALSTEELDAWKSGMSRHGVGALKVTRIQDYRQP